jgi:TonB-dependent SusC/RagA subfamily outer membrane receptor
MEESMRTLRRHLGPSAIAGLACTLATGCMQQPVASNLRTAPVPPGNASMSYEPRSAGDVLVSDGSAQFPADGASRYANVEEMLAGRVAGLEVLRQGSGRFSLRVRGLGTVGGGGDPLLVMDGVSMYGTAVEVLSGLSPRDVQRVEVLKDISSTAIYGYRGTNGVILITTRRR